MGIADLCPGKREFILGRLTSTEISYEAVVGIHMRGEDNLHFAEGKDLENS